MIRMLTYICTMFLVRFAIAQEIIADTTAGLRIPPFEVVLAAAIEHSPILKISALEAEKNRNEIAIQRKKWMNYIFIEGASNYGRYDQVVLSGITSDGVVTSGIASKNEQLRYYAGLGVKLPISAISSRNNEIRIKELNGQQLEFEQTNVQQDIKQTIIEEYYKLTYLEESMKTFSFIYQTLDISLQKAERELLNGRIQMSEYALLVSTVGKSKDDFYKAKSNFHAQYLKLQNIAGISFDKI